MFALEVFSAMLRPGGKHRTVTTAIIDSDERHSRRRPQASGSEGAATMRALAAAREISDEGGEISLRIIDVSRQSHVSIGSLYHHFGSREGLVDAAREHEFLDGLVSDTCDATVHLMKSSTSEEFIERFDEVLHWSDDPQSATARGRRFEIIGSIAAKPGSLAGVVAIQVAHMDAVQSVASTVRDRGWLAEGIDVRAFALFLHAVSMARVLRDVDDQVSAEEWRRVVDASLGGLMPHEERPSYEEAQIS